MSSFKRKGCRWKYKQLLFKEQNGLCPYCLCDMKLQRLGNTPKNVATIDHLRPRSLGGTHALDNLILCCSGCNNRRGASSLVVFLQSSWIRRKIKRRLHNRSE